MSVVKIIELVGSSTKGWKEAAENALMEASKTVRNIVGMDVVGCTAKVEKNKIVTYRANVKIAFTAERP
ncbi:MAG: dodecin family protein [Candidatus Bathyarchaeota archaeon]|nr:dodecin family protein [Candidatus Bathyarchaeota archaeon]MDH5746159.1 dodecin family protein [Candidatus Bathyarchaeota archaeon]